MLTFSALKTQVLSWLDEAGDTSTTDTNVGYALNAAHDARCQLDRWTFMFGPQLSFSTVIGQTRYALDPAFGRALYFYLPDTCIFLTEITTRGLETYAGFNTATDGAGFYFAGMWPVALQPSASSVLTIVSTSASDNTAAKAVLVTGRTANGIRSESITPNGITPVAGLLAFTEILSLSLSATWAGTCTVTSDSAATTNVVLTAGETARQHPVIQLLWTPGTAIEIDYRFLVTPRRMVNDGDIPNIPYPHSQVLVWDALLLMAAYDSQTDPGRVRVWSDYRDQLELQMRQTYLEGQTIGAQVRYVRAIDDGQITLRTN